MKRHYAGRQLLSRQHFCFSDSCGLSQSRRPLIYGVSLFSKLRPGGILGYGNGGSSKSLFHTASRLVRTSSSLGLAGSKLGFQQGADPECRQCRARPFFQLRTFTTARPPLEHSAG